MAAGHMRACAVIKVLKRKIGGGRRGDRFEFSGVVERFMNIPISIHQSREIRGWERRLSTWNRSHTS